MNDLILISSYCDTNEKQDILRNLVTQIHNEKGFDIMVVSHTTIPQDIQNKCNYVFYDSKNELLYDWDFRTKGWFSPNNSPIHSVFTGFYNTHLAIWRMIILGNSLAKNLGYNKVHHIEYDTSILDFSELYDNSILLETNDSIYYNKSEKEVADILFGTYQAYRLDTLNNELLNLDENLLKSQIKNSRVKSPEQMLEILLTNNKKFIVKSWDNLKLNGNSFGLSDNVKNTLAWCLPFYNRKNNSLEFIAWNKEGFNSIDIKIIYNDSKTFNIKNLGDNVWSLIELDSNYDNAQNLVILYNNKIRNIFDFNKIREDFKLNSYI